MSVRGFEGYIFNLIQVAGIWWLCGAISKLWWNPDEKLSFKAVERSFRWFSPVLRKILLAITEFEWSTWNRIVITTILVRSCQESGIKEFFTKNTPEPIGLISLITSVAAFICLYGFTWKIPFASCFSANSLQLWVFTISCQLRAVLARFWPNWWSYSNFHLDNPPAHPILQELIRNSSHHSRLGLTEKIIPESAIHDPLFSLPLLKEFRAVKFDKNFEHFENQSISYPKQHEFDFS